MDRKTTRELTLWEKRAEWEKRRSDATTDGEREVCGRAIERLEIQIKAAEKRTAAALQKEEEVENKSSSSDEEEEEEEQAPPTPNLQQRGLYTSTYRPKAEAAQQSLPKRLQLSRKAQRKKYQEEIEEPHVPYVRGERGLPVKDKAYEERRRQVWSKHRAAQRAANEELEYDETTGIKFLFD